jgi:hypothetical protein
MTAGTSSSVCLQLGGAAVSDPASYTTILIAKTADGVAAARGGLVPSSVGRLDVVVDSSDVGTLYDPMELAGWVPLLTPDAVVSVRVRGPPAGSLQPVSTSFLLAGLASASELRLPDGGRVLTATRGAAPKAGAALLRKKAAPAPPAAPPAVTLNLDDDYDDAAGEEEEDGDGLIDEGGLLDDDTMLAPPPAMTAAAAAAGGDDCAGRTACDNCTCGRADQEDSAAASGQQPKQAPKSSCGKCHLGDAFRCASCPYLGKPAFKPGEEHLVLQLTDDL